MLMRGGRGDRQQLADRLDPMFTAMVEDELDPPFDRRSSSAIAKSILSRWPAAGFVDTKIRS
ncbi:hypothetical protein [Rhodobacter viridis]|uniref:hypothetical protein n=1 Tax=Rhodobacter viridis TaxID=1054202 RepID=UPI000DA179BC